MSKKHVVILQTILLLVLLSGCESSNRRKKITLTRQQIGELTKDIAKSSTTTKPRITVFIHGTRLFGSKIFHKLCFCPPGFYKAHVLSADFQSRWIADYLCTHDPSRFDFKQYYLFGWPGALNFDARLQAAHKLATSLRPVVDELKQKHGHTPEIRIITHSHGGNVALNLARHKKVLKAQITELILLACPVQQETAHLLHDDCFKRVYSFFSTMDSLQVLDPQGLYSASPMRSKGQKTPILSQRCFKHNAKIKQIQIKMYGRGLMHIEFLWCRFIKRLPVFLAIADNITTDLSGETILLHVRP